MVRFRAAAAALLALSAPAALPAQQDSTRPPAPSRPALQNEPGAISLDRAVAIAQERSHAARAARANRSAARYRDQAFGSRLLPQLSLTGTLPNYSRAVTPQIELIRDSSGAVIGSNTIFVPEQRMQASLGLRLSQRLPLTGGELFMTSQLAQLQQTLGQQRNELWSSTPFSIGLRQDILRPNLAGWDQREQGVRRGRDERAYLEAMEDIALQTTELYFNLFAARMALANAEANAAVNDTLYRMNRGRLEIGRIGENELLQSELQLLRARTTLEGARLEYDRAVAQLRIGLGIGPREPVSVMMTSTIPTYAVDTARAVSEALRNRATVLDAELAEVQARRRIAEARLAAGVGATVFAAYGYNSSSAASMNLAYQNLLESRQFTVTVSMPLWQWGARGENVRAAEADRDRALSQNELAVEQLGHDARFAALQLIQARRNVALLATADTVAGRRFDVTYNRYVIGRVSVENLFIAQNEKDQALTQYVNGLRQFWQAHYRLRRTTLFDFAAGQAIR